MKALNLTWEYKIPNDISANKIRPIVTNKQIFLHSGSFLYSFDKETGSLNWKNEIGMSSLSDLFFHYQDLIICATSSKTGRQTEGISEFKYQLKAVNTSGQVVWELPVSFIIDGKSYYKDGEFLWLLSHHSEIPQQVLKIHILNGQLIKTIVLPKYQADKLVILSSERLLLSYQQGNKQQAGLFIYNIKNNFIEVLKKGSVYEIFLSKKYVIYSIKENEKLFLEIVEQDNWNTMLFQQRINKESILVDDGMLFFLQKNEELTLIAINVSGKIIWQIDVPKDSSIIRDSNAFLTLSTRFKKILISKQAGEVVHTFKKLSHTPTSEAGFFYHKEKDVFFKAKFK